MNQKNTKKDVVSFSERYNDKIEVLGYTTNCHINAGTLEVIITPLEGSPNPINPDLLTKIKDTILPKKFKGVLKEYPVYVEYSDDPVKPLSKY
ncbi:MAG: hypothetical protein ISS23_01940 [Nanoarchaeota archaeon]|nr:hypothetical protein [Nanoarchaeota archaeon]